MEQAIGKKMSTLKYVSLLFISSFIFTVVFHAVTCKMKLELVYHVLLFQISIYTFTFLLFAIFCHDEITNLVKNSYMLIKNKLSIRNMILFLLFGSFSAIILQSIVYLFNMYLLHIRNVNNDVNNIDSFDKVIKNLIESNNVHSIVILLTMVFFSGIITPIIEEIIFRGLILQSLIQKMDIRIAILIGALIFGLWHIDLYTALNAFLFGIILSIFYVRYNSIFVPIAMHMGANIFVQINIILSFIIKGRLY
ncbi:CPBP family intramembrane glutamic endopeptidase [Caldicellulosiruptor morganii]|uniref:CPBP family intramembrane metalloprotease n=1 Tax=Caldicellulosiruptor morganii TaxID=1387555 RepID=A0ABY7BIZ7_9FIRM|nr:CPBP family intramembrane glutamic endopeptidase [Caldicellulosiruptor morganii]WAM32794.1 CPBP family intramembrane metalloprotease [Caldicellulosiruptor morganii]